MGRGDLADAEWERLRPFLPVSNGRCGRWRDHRQVIERGGLTSKLHLSADGRCRPLSLIVTGGQRARSSGRSTIARTSP